MHILSLAPGRGRTRNSESR